MTTDPLAVACPLCLAPAGASCHTLGLKTPRPPHGDREQLARRTVRGLEPDPDQEHLDL